MRAVAIPTTTVKAYGALCDLVAIDRALRGGSPQPTLTVAERLLATHRLVEAGHGAGTVSSLLGVSGTSAAKLMERVMEARETYVGQRSARGGRGVARG